MSVLLMFAGGLFFAAFLMIVVRGAPYVPTHQKRAKLALDLLELPAGATIVDLGSGDGVVLKLAAQRGLHAIGYELNPFLCLASYIRCWKYRVLVSVQWRDFWLTPLPPQTDAVFVFLAGPYMNKFAKKITKEMQSRQRDLYIVSYGFEIPGWQPYKKDSEIYCYKQMSYSNPKTKPAFLAAPKRPGPSSPYSPYLRIRFARTGQPWLAWTITQNWQVLFWGCYSFRRVSCIRSCYNDDMKKVDTVSIAELSDMAQKMYGNLVKGVVDLSKDILVVDAEMHADQEQLLLEEGSRQADLWGINLYPEKFGTDDFVEFDSMINIRPRQNNLSRGVEDENIQKQIVALVSKKVTA